MQKIYSLLRNNKQSGPYSLEELLQMTLKPFDLIWVNGTSSGWSYPTEIEALKIYVSDTSKPIDKKQINNPDLPDADPASFGTHNIIPPKKSFPSNPRANHIYVSFPNGKEPISENTTATEFSSDEESPEAKLERKAQQLRNKIQAFAENKNAPKNNEEPDTKYSRSLDDIKEEYSLWLHQQRKKKKTFLAKYLVPAVAIVILSTGIYFSIPLFSDSKANVVFSAQNTDTSTRESENYLAAKELDKPKKKNTTKSVNRRKKIKEKLPKAKSTRVYTSDEIDEVDAYLDSLKKASGKEKNNESNVVTQPSVTENNGTRQSTKRTAEASAQESKTKDSTPFTELIKLSESTGAGTPHISLYNNSNKFINFVALDVYYYKANQKLLLKKTLYFNDISPNSSARLYLPQEKKAASVKYQIGLISTDNGLFYAKQ
jgi:hypothetical protein